MKHYNDVTMGSMASQITNSHDYSLDRLFRRRSKKASKLRATGLCEGIHRGPVISPHKGSVTRKMFPFDDVIMMCDMNMLYIKSSVTHVFPGST